MYVHIVYVYIEITVREKRITTLTITYFMGRACAQRRRRRARRRKEEKKACVYLAGRNFRAYFADSGDKDCGYVWVSPRMYMGVSRPGWLGVTNV